MRRGGELSALGDCGVHMGCHAIRLCARAALTTVVAGELQTVLTEADAGEAQLDDRLLL